MTPSRTATGPAVPKKRRSNRPGAGELLTAAVGAVPGGAARPGQQQMAEAIERSIGSGEHLLVVTHHLGLGGGQLYLQELLRRLLAQDDVTCTVVAPTDGPLRTELEELGARVLVVGRAPVTAVEYEDWMHLLTSAAATTGATSALVNTAGCYWGVDLADRLGIPSVWSVHESFRPEHFVLVGFPAPPDAWVVERFTSAFALAGRVVFEADATMDLFTHLIRDDRALRVDYGIDVDAVQAFVDTHDRDAVRAQLGLGPDETVILCMGTYEPRKAQGLLARAFSELVTDHPRAVLVMVGDQDNEYSRAVHEVVERLGIEERVRMLPVTPLVDEWYLAADCLVLASDIESLSRAMLEAMAFGTPVLVSAVYGHRAVIEDGVNGFLLDSSSVAAVTAALRRILRLERAERAAVGERGRDWVRETRRSEGYAGAYRALIAELHAEQARVGEAS